MTKTDGSALKFYSRLNNLFYQFQAVGNNYNQVVRAINRGFTQRSASLFLARLVKETRELKRVSNEILALIRNFNDKYLPDDPSG